MLAGVTSQSRVTALSMMEEMYKDFVLKKNAAMVYCNSLLHKQTL